MLLQAAQQQVNHALFGVVVLAGEIINLAVVTLKVEQHRLLDLGERRGSLDLGRLLTGDLEQRVLGAFEVAATLNLLRAVRTHLFADGVRQCGVLEARLVAGDRRAEVGVAAVGDVDGHGVHAVQGVATRGRVSIRHERHEGGAAHICGNLAAVGLKHRGHDVDCLSELAGMLAGAGVTREVHNERQMRELVIQVHVVFAHVVALAQEIAVVGGDHDHGIVQHPALLELVDEPTKPAVGHGDEGLVAALQVVLRALVDVGGGDALVLRNLEVVAVELASAAVHLHVLVGHIEGLVRVEGLNHKEEVVGPSIAVDPVAGGLEGLGARHVLFVGPELTVLLVLLAHAPVEGLGHVIRLIDAADPRVALLAAVVIPGVELLEVALATGA